MPDPPVRWGIPSTANIARDIVAAAQQSDDVEVVAVASRDRRRALAFASEWNLERAYGSYDELFRDPDIEAIYNPLPNALHIPFTLLALEAGKHVLCEKPMARRPAEVSQAFDVAERHGLVLMEGFMYRHHPMTEAMSALVQQGQIGQLRSIRAAFTFPLGGAGQNIRLQADLDGGSLMDLGAYCVDTARLLAGSPRHVHGEQVLSDTGVDLAFHGTLRFADDVTCQFSSSFLEPMRQTIDVVGDEGVLSSDAPWRIDWGGGLTLRRGGKAERIDVGDANSYRAELESVSAALRGRAEPRFGRSDAVEQASVLEALYRSANEGRRVVLEG